MESLQTENQRILRYLFGERGDAEGGFRQKPGFCDNPGSFGFFSVSSRQNMIRSSSAFKTEISSVR